MKLVGGRKLKNSVDYETTFARRGEAKEIKYSPENQNVLKNRMIKDFESEIFHVQKNFSIQFSAGLPEINDSFGCKPFRGK